MAIVDERKQFIYILQMKSLLERSSIFYFYYSVFGISKVLISCKLRCDAYFVKGMTVKDVNLM